MECKQERNLRDCNCTYPGCPKKGLCCDCLRQHLAAKELPGCCFPDKIEKTFDRSFSAFAKAWQL